uniref:Innexin n=1 Tax=Ascaris lumbricoides TaxID=6252 RepID=A0A0M3HT97_ASCLU
MVLTTVLSMLRYVGEIDDRDFVDRLHSYFTTNILIAFAILVSFKQFGGKPVECLVPDMFSGAWEQYAENYCWAQDTYYVPMRDIVDGMPTAEKRQRRISYYQWVPFFLLIEAAFFRLPSLLWKYMAGYSGKFFFHCFFVSFNIFPKFSVNFLKDFHSNVFVLMRIKINEIVKLSTDPNNIKPEIKKANIKSLTVHLQGALRFHRRLQKKQILPHRIFRLLNIPYSASFVTSMYILTKLLYLFNVCVQLLIMNRFLETDHYSWYGLGAVLDLLNGTTWEQSGVFPRVSLCDFEVRVMGNIQEHTIQCVLVINIFNEKIFVFFIREFYVIYRFVPFSSLFVKKFYAPLPTIKTDSEHDMRGHDFMCIHRNLGASNGQHPRTYHSMYLALAILTTGSCLYWLFISLLPFPNRRFINRHLEMSEMPFDPSENKKDVRRFINGYLKSDGVFVIRMLTLHAGVIFGTDLVLSLWKSYFGIEQQLKRSSSFPAGATIWPPPPDKQISTVDLGAFENEQNRLRLRRNAAGKEPPSPTVKLNKENDELTKLMASSTDEPEPMPVTFSAGSPKRAPKTPPKPVIKESPKKVPNLII